MSRRSKIIVLRGGAIGDFILTFPVFAALRAQFPESRLEILGYPRIAELAMSAGLADAVLPIESPSLASFFAPQATLDPHWTAYFSDASLIISYIHDPDGIFETNIKRCSQAPFIKGPHRPLAGCGRHASDVLFDPLRTLGMAFPNNPPPLPIQPMPLPVAVPWLAVHPGSGSERKNWPPDRWEALLRAWLRWTDAGLLLIGGEAEGERIEHLTKACVGNDLFSDRVLTLESAPLPVVARHLKASHWFLGHDSGITHLAAALDIPGLVLWGESDAIVWRPQNERLRLLPCPTGLNNLAPESVLAALLDLRANTQPLPRAGNTIPAASDVLAIGYGNTLRSDDGIGPRVAELIQQWALRGVDTLAAHQLMPEMADALQRAKCVVFVDARIDSSHSATITCRPLTCPENGRIDPHLTTPEGLLLLAEKLYGHVPSAYLITAPISEIGYGEQLTAAGQAQAIQACEQFLKILIRSV